MRWLGTVAYRDAHALQQALFAAPPVGAQLSGEPAAGAPGDDPTARPDDWLLLLEHPHVYTAGVNADLDNVLVSPASVGAELIKTDRGGDVTYHGPGQLVGYPILTVPGKRGGGLTDTVAYVRAVEQLIIDTLADLGLSDTGRLRDHPGVWVAPESDDPRKVAAIGVRLSRGRSMHGFALNVDPDLTFFDHIVPCGIPDKAVTSLAAEGIDVSMREVVDALTARATGPSFWGQLRGEPSPEGPSSGPGGSDRDGGGAPTAQRSDVVWRHRSEDLSAFSRGEGPGVTEADVRRGTTAVDLAAAPVDHGATPASPEARADHGTSVRLRGRLAEAGVSAGIAIAERKPDWMRAKVRIGEGYTGLRSTMRDLGLVTVCEEAGCPNIFECWADGTATFMINGERCTRACGFCLVDTRHPEPLDATEPDRVAEAVQRMKLQFAVVTAVARDDLADGGADAFARTIDAIHRTSPRASVEVLIPDCKGDPESLDVIFRARPEVLNHNIETVARLQRAARPSAGYVRSLAVLARAKAAGLTTKSGMVLGMGEDFDEIVATLADLRGVGVDIVTLGQYLRPTTNHLPVARWWTPEEFDEMARIGHAMGIGHVEASPLTRSSYHARQAAEGTALPPVADRVAS